MKTPSKCYTIVLPWHPANQGGVSGVAHYLGEALAATEDLVPKIWVSDWSHPHPAEQDGYLNFRFALLAGNNPVAAIKALVRAPLQLWRTAQLLRERKVVAVNFHYPDEGALGCALLKRFGVYQGKLALSFHGTDVRHEPARLARWSMQFCLRQADAIVAVSEGLKRRLVDTYGLPPERVSVIWNGADTRVFHPAARSASAELTTLPRPYLVSVGAFIPRKAQADLINAFARIASDWPAHHLVLAGADGESLSGLRVLVNQLGLDTRVHFLVGLQREEVAALLAASTLCVQPALAESLPLAVLEAGACDVPLLVSDIPGHDEMVQPGVSGALFAVRNPEACAQAINAALRQPEASMAMARQFGEVVRNQHTWAACAARYRGLLKL